MFLFFFFNDTATTEIYTLSLHDALPIFVESQCAVAGIFDAGTEHDMAFFLLRLTEISLTQPAVRRLEQDRKSTRLNSSHANISYAVFCLKKKKKKMQKQQLA